MLLIFFLEIKKTEKTLQEAEISTEEKKEEKSSEESSKNNQNQEDDVVAAGFDGLLIRGLSDQDSNQQQQNPSAEITTIDDGEFELQERSNIVDLGSSNKIIAEILAEIMESGENDGEITEEESDGENDPGGDQRIWHRSHHQWDRSGSPLRAEVGLAAEDGEVIESGQVIGSGLVIKRDEYENSCSLGLLFIIVISSKSDN